MVKAKRKMEAKGMCDGVECGIFLFMLIKCQYEQIPI